MFRVMIVDDMEVVRRQIKRLPLWGESTGFRIADEAEDGQEALEKLQVEPVELLITDIRMPRIDGIELLKEVQERSLALCVVFLSEHGEFSFAKEAIQYGIFDYLVKPVNYDELNKLLKKAEKYIEVRREAQLQIKTLEDKLIEKLDVFYPGNRVEAIVRYISGGDRKALEVISTMIEETAASLSLDVMKTAIVLQKVCDEIWMGVKAHHGWIEQFIDDKDFKDICLTRYSSIDSMKNKVIEIMDSEISIIERFIFNVEKNPLIERICNYVVKNINKEVSISKISKALFLTKNYIGDIFKKETGMTIGEYITIIKIERAKQLIRTGNLKNYEIAHILAYNDVEYFGKVFKKNTGLTPAEFRASLKN